MILLTKDQSVVLWGVEVLDDSVYADLAFFGESLPPIVTLSNRNQSITVKAEIPQQQVRNPFAGKAQQILLRLIA